MFNIKNPQLLLVANRQAGQVKKESQKFEKFNFDRVFGPESTQTEVFLEVSELVKSALDGFNVCIFAYGQTGAGKTHTMTGTTDDPGIIPQAVNMIFQMGTELNDLKSPLSITMSCIEIYIEKVRDLLDCSKETSTIMT